MNPLLLSALALAAQAGVFEDRESGFRVQVPLGWHLTFAGPEGRAAMRRLDDPNAFLRLEITEIADESLPAGKWDAYLEKYKETLAGRLADFVVRRHAVAPEGAPSSLELWFSAGKGEEAVESHARFAAVPGRMLIVSGTTTKAKWGENGESIESTSRSAGFLQPAKDAGASWIDAANGFSIGVPAGHRVRPEKRGNMVVSISAPDNSANMNVIVQGAERAFAQLSEKDLRANLEAKLKSIPNFAYLEFSKIAWNGRPAVKSVGEFNQGEIQASNLQFGVSTDRKSYYLTWTARRDLFAKERPAFEAALKTFALSTAK
jgi:hypothetical protein